MSGVAQRAGQVDIGAAAAVSRWEVTGRADTQAGYPRPRLPQYPVNMAGAALPQTDQLIWQHSAGFVAPAAWGWPRGKPQRIETIAVPAN